MKLLKKYKDHPSIFKITENIVIDGEFTFADMDAYKIGINIYQLDPKGAVVANNIPSKLQIKTSDIVSQYL